MTETGKPGLIMDVMTDREGNIQGNKYYTFPLPPSVSGGLGLGLDSFQITKNVSSVTNTFTSNTTYDTVSVVPDWISSFTNSTGILVLRPGTYSVNIFSGETTVGSEDGVFSAKAVITNPS